MFHVSVISSVSENGPQLRVSTNTFHHDSTPGNNSSFFSSCLGRSIPIAMALHVVPSENLGSTSLFLSKVCSRREMASVRSAQCSSESSNTEGIEVAPAAAEAAALEALGDEVTADATATAEGEEEDEEEDDDDNDDAPKFQQALKRGYKCVEQ